jgi:hypothetical protein
MKNLDLWWTTVMTRQAQAGCVPPTPPSPLLTDASWVLQLGQDYITIWGAAVVLVAYIFIANYLAYLGLRRVK